MVMHNPLFHVGLSIFFYPLLCCHSFPPRLSIPKQRGIGLSHSPSCWHVRSAEPRRWKPRLQWTATVTP